MKETILETQRLLLKHYTPESYSRVFNEKTDDQIMAIFGFSDKEQLKKEKEKFSGNNSYYYKLLAHFQLIIKSSQTVIGSAGFHNWHPFHRRAELGYAILKDEFKNLGFMSEAIPTIVDFGFNTLNLHRMEACVSPENLISQKIVKKLGFQEEGLMKEHYFHQNKFEDSILFCLLFSEWETQSKLQ